MGQRPAQSQCREMVYIRDLCSRETAWAREAESEAREGRAGDDGVPAIRHRLLQGMNLRRLVSGDQWESQEAVFGAPRFPVRRCRGRIRTGAGLRAQPKPSPVFIPDEGCSGGSINQGAPRRTRSQRPHIIGGVISTWRRRGGTSATLINICPMGLILAWHSTQGPPVRPTHNL